MTIKSELVVEGILFGEGPVWCPQDSTVVATSVAEGALYKVWPQQQKKQRIAVTHGGANAAAPAVDGGFLVTQNGGIDFKGLAAKTEGAELFRDLPDPVYVTPSIQRVTPNGEVLVLNDGSSMGGFNAPNDLIISQDGTIFFTDPGHIGTSDKAIGRLFSITPDGQLHLIASGFSYCNGIVLDKDGQLVVVEGKGLQRVFADGSREWVIEDLGEGGGDGFCVDTEGRFYVASTIAHGIRVIDSDGTVLDFLEIAGQGLCTNCCFGGADGKTLFVTDAIPGNLVAFEGMATAGREIYQWSA